MLALTDSALAPHCFGATAPGPTAVARLNSSPPCCRDGCTESILLAHGFTIEQMVELLRAGLATATPERVIAGGKPIEVARGRITEVGRRAITTPASGPTHVT